MPTYWMTYGKQRSYAWKYLNRHERKAWHRGDKWLRKMVTK